MLRAILTDIEGTTSSISFVKDVLFPYAAKNMRSFLQAHWQHADVQKQIAAIAEITQTRIDTVDAADAVLQQWIADDQKITPLKALQGMIWKQGYADGDYRAHMYPDAPTRLRQWHADGFALYVYSSGSVAAQKLFFGYSEAGDLTGLFSGYFDTTVGGKRDSTSYAAISDTIGVPADQILFLSDIIEELDAAHAVGMKTVWLDRSNAALPCAHPRAQSFVDINPQAW